MADVIHSRAVTRSPWLPWLMLGGIAANLFAIVTVNYWIYHARAVFIATHPDYVAIRPPTISKAISDPAIGEPFAFWVTLCAVLLVFGVAMNASVYLRLARGGSIAARRVATQVFVLAIGLAASQAAASVGMYLLSAYRFPHYNAMHMTGSYLFFVAEMMVILVFSLISLVLLRSRVDLDRLEKRGHVRRRSVRLRAVLGLISVIMTIAYIALFQMKGIDFGSANRAIYQAYVLLEPAVISSFLLVFALFQTDLWAVARGRAGG